MDQVSLSVVVSVGLNLAIFSSSLSVLKCWHSVRRCIMSSGELLQSLHFVSGSFLILLLNLLRLLCPVIISISSLRSCLESLSICLLYLGSIRGKKIFVCLNISGLACHFAIHSAYIAVFM